MFGWRKDVEYSTQNCPYHCDLASFFSTKRIQNVIIRGVRNLIAIAFDTYIYINILLTTWTTTD